jgi:hypothetical protein
MIESIIKIYRTLLLDYTHIAIIGNTQSGKNILI